VLEGRLVHEPIAVLFECARHCGRAPRTWAIHQARRSLLGKALHPCAQSRMRKVKGRGDGMDVVASDNLTDDWRAAKDARLLGLREHGI
jgi:hypothetical protein